MTRRHPPALPRLGSLLAACALGALATACKTDPATTGDITVSDYRARHPIVLADGTRSLDVFPTGIGHLDPRQTADIDAFMLEYRRYGRGILLMEVPQGVPPAMAQAVARTAAALSRLGGQSGVGAREIAVTGYAASAPTLAAPIRLSFQRMQAKVADQCGLWPQDLGTSSFQFDYSNRPSWNLGCAMQSTWPPRWPTRSIWCAAGPRAGSTRSSGFATSASCGMARIRQPHGGKMGRPPSSLRSANRAAAPNPDAVPRTRT